MLFCLDHLTIAHEVLKVETIGDAYFVASGVLEEREDHAQLVREPRSCVYFQL